MGTDKLIKESVIVSPISSVDGLNDAINDSDTNEIMYLLSTLLMYDVHCGNSQILDDHISIMSNWTEKHNENHTMYFAKQLLSFSALIKSIDNNIKIGLLFNRNNFSLDFRSIKVIVITDDDTREMLSAVSSRVIEFEDKHNININFILASEEQVKSKGIEFDIDL